MPADTLRYAKAREHLHRLVGLYVSTEETPENDDILRDIEWLAEQMAQMSPAQFLDTVAPETVSPQQSSSSEPKRRTAA